MFYDKSAPLLFLAGLNKACECSTGYFRCDKCKGKGKVVSVLNEAHAMKMYHAPAALPPWKEPPVPIA